MHNSTFEYLKPTDAQIEDMAEVRKAFAELVNIIDGYLPLGQDKDYTLRLIRTAGMWANVSITRQDDGTPRK